MTLAVARLVIRYGKLAEWNDAMGRLLPIMEDQGWKLLASYQTVIGNFHEAYDIWEIPNADAVGAGLVGAASHPDFGTLGADLAAAIETETLSIVVEAPFTQAGRQ